MLFALQVTPLSWADWTAVFYLSFPVCIIASIFTTQENLVLTLATFHTRISFDICFYNELKIKLTYSLHSDLRI